MFDTDGVRGLLGELARSRQQPGVRGSPARGRASVSRKYLVREELLRDDPTPSSGAPRKERTLPAHLRAEDMGRLLEAPDSRTVAGRAIRAYLELFYRIRAALERARSGWISRTST
jgi:site-specific recombinase XerC